MASNCIVILAPSEWGQVAVSNMQYALRFSRQDYNSVYYFESIATRAPRISDFLRIMRRVYKAAFGVGTPRAEWLDPENLNIISPFVVPWHNLVWAQKVNKNLLWRQLNSVLTKHENCQVTVVAYNPYWIDVLDNLVIPHKLIFHCVDKLSTYSTSSSYFKNLEQLKIKANSIIIPNKILMEDFKVYAGKTHVIPHGCSHTPQKIRSNIKNKVVYSGNLADWVDFNLLIQLVTSCPNFEFNFVGTVTARTNFVHVQKILGLPNVKYHGQIEYGKLAMLYKECSIGIVPYDAFNDHIKYSTPTKFSDYIFAGLRVISTDFPNAHDYGNLVEVAKNTEDFINLLKVPWEYDSTYEAERQKMIQTSSWDSRFDEFVNVINFAN